MPETGPNSPAMDDRNRKHDRTCDQKSPQSFCNDSMEDFEVKFRKIVPPKRKQA